MITHTLIFGFPADMPEAERERFFAEITELMLGPGGAISVAVDRHLSVAEDDAHAPVFAAGDISHMVFADLDAVHAASSLPELEEFIGRWQSRYPYGVVWANQETPAATASS